MVQFRTKSTLLISSFQFAYSNCRDNCASLFLTHNCSYWIIKPWLQKQWKHTGGEQRDDVTIDFHLLSDWRHSSPDSPVPLLSPGASICTIYTHQTHPASSQHPPSEQHSPYLLKKMVCTYCRIWSRRLALTLNSSKRWLGKHIKEIKTKSEAQIHV